MTKNITAWTKKKWRRKQKGTLIQKQAKPQSQTKQATKKAAQNEAVPARAAAEKDKGHNNSAIQTL